MGLAMDVAVHLGFHCTDDERLSRCLLRNAAALESLGVAVPPPPNYRPVLKEALVAQREAGELPGTVATRLAEALGARPGLRRMVLSHPNLICFPGRAISDEGLYAAAPKRIAQLDAALKGTLAEVHLALRNPATLIPALLDQVADADYLRMMCGLEPMQLSWAETITRIRAELPALRMVIWCNEDLPLIWPELVRRVAGVPPGTAMEGDEEMLGALLTPVGMATLAAYIKAQGPIGVGERRRLTTALLERYAQPGQIDIELDLPGWTGALVEEVTDAYYSDVARIAEIKGVEFLAP